MQTVPAEIDSEESCASPSPTAALADAYARPSNATAALQCLTTLAPIALIWFAYASLPLDTPRDYALALLLGVAMTLCLVRVFVLMHDCGHDSLFRSRTGNRVAGFVFGVLAGMPQAVWARHHQYHHVTNGNWQRYRGPLNVMSVDDYRKLDPAARRRYCLSRSIWIAPLAGLHYLVVSPRITWLRATLGLCHFTLGRRFTDRPDTAQISAFGTSYCKSASDYRHMLGNNLALLALATAMALAMGPARFLAFHVTTLAFAGGGAILLFAIQHNFEGSYASGDEGWDRGRAAIDGTSFLVLPAWLNWFTADIAYHHVHHLCARIPNYRLADCHHEHAARFEPVRRIRLSEVPHQARCILWDVQARRIVAPESVALSAG